MTSVDANNSMYQPVPPDVQAVPAMVSAMSRPAATGHADLGRVPPQSIEAEARKKKGNA